MPATQAFAGQGATLEYTDGSVYTKLGQIKTIDFTGAKTQMDNISNMDSPSAYEEYLPTMISAGEVSFEGVMQPDADVGGTTATLQAKQDARELLTWKLIEPSTTLTGSQTTPATFGFSAYISELSFKLAFDKATIFSGKLTITGPRTFTPAS